MTSMRRAGGVGAFVCAGAFIAGLVMYATMLLDYTTADAPADAVRFLVDHEVALRAWNLLVTVVFALATIPLVLALRDRLISHHPTLVRSQTALGTIWAGLLLATGMITNVGFTTVLDLQQSEPDRAVTVWAALDAVQRGIGGGNELVGGLWVLTVSALALSAGAMGRVVGYVGIASGIAGLLTVVPALEDLGAVFGLGMIVWYVLSGVELLWAPERSEVTATNSPLTGRAIGNAG